MRKRLSSKLVRRAFAMWLPLAVLATLSILATYSAVQQDLRQTANDPQRGMALDAAVRLDGGAHASDVVGISKVEMSSSLTPFVLVLDSGGNVLASGATLDGSVPQPPLGLVGEAHSLGHDDVTWQPRAGVRSAAVVVPWKGGAVLSGRSLTAIEEREDSILADLFLGGLITLACLAAACLLAARLWPSMSADAPV